MKPLIPVLLAGVAVAIAIANGIASAHGLLRKCAWLAPVLYGTAALLLITAVAILKEWPWSSARFYVPAVIALSLTFIWTVAVATRSRANTSSETANYPKIEFKESEQQIFQEAYAISATVASFRNDAVVGQELTFEAQIIYKDAAGREIANVARGVWLPVNSSHPHTTTFDTGVPRNLGIFFVREGILFKPIADWVREHLVVSYALIPRVKFEEFTAKIASVEIRLLSGTRKRRTFILEVSDYQKDKLPVLLLRRNYFLRLFLRCLHILPFYRGRIQ